MVDVWFTRDVYRHPINGAAGESEWWLVVRRDRRSGVAADTEARTCTAEETGLRLNLGLSHLLRINVEGERAESTLGLWVLARLVKFGSEGVPTSD